MPFEEFLEWQAYYELRAEEQKKELEKAKRNRKSRGKS